MRRAVTAGLLLLACGDPSGADTPAMPDAQPSDPDAEQAPPITAEPVGNMRFTDCDGAEISLVELTEGAKVTWLSIQAGWCPGCSRLRRFLDELHTDWGPQGVVVAIVLGEDDTPGSGQVGHGYCARLRDRDALQLPILRDEGFIETKAYANALPHQILLDAHRIVRARDNGWEAWMETRYRSLIDALLAETVTPP